MRIQNYRLSLKYGCLNNGNEWILVLFGYKFDAIQVRGLDAYLTLLYYQHIYFLCVLLNLL